MPPSGRVEVCVEVTSTEDNEVELVVFSSSEEDAAVPDVAVESVVPSVVEGAVGDCQPGIYIHKCGETMGLKRQASVTALHMR